MVREQTGVYEVTRRWPDAWCINGLRTNNKRRELYS